MPKPTHILDLKLHESIKLEASGLYVTRVPGGWIYETHDENSCAMVFVPWDNSNEFIMTGTESC